MTPIQQLFLGTGSAVATKNYIDDVFSTFLYEGKGDNTTNSVTNNVDLTEGGIVWTKGRDITYSHIIYDSLRGQNYLTPNENYAQATDSRSNIAFNSTGYTFGDASSTSWGPLNEGNKNFASWTFRKAPGFFDCKVWNGNSTAGRQISHDLGCVPGVVIVKETTGTESWTVYHRGNPNPGTDKLKLDSHNAVSTSTSSWNSTTPTSTYVELGSNSAVNASSKSYVGYFFAGGESTAATAVSVDFDGDDHLDVATSSDLDLGTGDFTIEFWAKFDGTNTYLECCFDGRHPSNTNNGLMVARWHTSGHENKVSVYMGGFLCEEQGSSPNGQWNHFAVVRASGTTSLYKNGNFEDSFSDSNDWSNDTWNIACLGNDESGHNNAMRGWISNFRVVKGTAVYTGSFRTPTTPLTAITNTKLLCCQSSTVTASTGVTLSANGNPAASTDSPFDDTAGFIFGENEDQGIVKCGNYIGNGSGAGTNEIDLGWEPQWLLIKRASGTASWRVYDTMRGIVTGGDDARLLADSTSAEATTGTNEIDLTPTGFKLVSYSAGINGDGDNYVYIALRRPDGYVGKPPELGTDVFAMDTGNSSSTIPTFDSGFAVDWAFVRQFAGTDNWGQYTRLTGDKFMRLNTNDAQGTYSGGKWDSNVGWAAASFWDSNRQSWMWKRHAGFDVVTYKGDGVAGRELPHSLNKTVEMMWVKKRNGTGDWSVYHKGLNGGTNPETRTMYLNDPDAEYTQVTFNNTAPTSTHFTVGSAAYINGNGDNFLALLFASVDGISKVGSYTGSGSSNTQTITTGFQPRFVIIKDYTGNNNPWYVMDTTRGWGSGDDKQLMLNSTQSELTNDWGAPTSTGFTVTGNGINLNSSSNKYIYYAHA